MSDANQIQGLPEGAIVGPPMQHSNPQVEGLPPGAVIGPSLQSSAPLTEKDAASGAYASQQAAPKTSIIQPIQDATAVSAGEGGMGITITGTPEEVQNVRNQVAEGGKRNLEALGTILAPEIEAPAAAGWATRMLARLATAASRGTGAAVGNVAGQAASTGKVNPGEAAETGAAVAAGDVALGAVTGAAKSAYSGAKKAYNVLRPGENAASQGLKDAIGKVANIKEPEVVNQIHDMLEPQKWLSSVENDMKLVKPKVEGELSKASGELESLRQSSTGTIENAKQTIHSFLDDLVTKAQDFGLDKDAVTKGIHNVRDEVASKLSDDSMSFKDLNDVKRMVDDQISTWKRQAPVTDTVKKAEQETLRGVRARIQDLENKAEPAAKAVNGKISTLVQTVEALEKKFPNLDTAEKAAESYAAARGQELKNAAKATAKRALVYGGGLGLGELGVEGLKHLLSE